MTGVQTCALPILERGALIVQRLEGREERERGGEKDFQQLIKEAKKRGINIILDGVFNHTGQDSKYFNRFNSYNSIGAYNSRDSKYYDWYIFKDYPNDYESWWGVKDLPTINKKSKAFVDYIINNDDSVVNKWLNMGIKGWRLDVADELSENFLKQLRKKCHEINKESVILGEVWEDATNKISYGVRREYIDRKSTRLNSSH